MTICVMYRFYVQKDRHVEKKDNLYYIFIYKKPDTLHSIIFHGSFEIDAEGGWAFYEQKQCTYC